MSEWQPLANLVNQLHIVLQASQSPLLSDLFCRHTFYFGLCMPGLDICILQYLDYSLTPPTLPNNSMQLIIIIISVRRFQLTKLIDRSHFQLYLLCHESSQHQGSYRLTLKMKINTVKFDIEQGRYSMSPSQVASICTQAPKYTLQIIFFKNALEYTKKAANYKFY